MNSIKLFYHQEDLMKKINNNNIIVVNWRTGMGLDFALETYMKINDNKIFFYSGPRSHFRFFEKHDNLNYVSKSDTIERILSKNIDFLIYEKTEFGRHKEIIDYCLSRNITIIIKQNRYELNLSEYEYSYSSSNITKQSDRLKKLERILEE